MEKNQIFRHQADFYIVWEEFYDPLGSQKKRQDFFPAFFLFLKQII